MAAGILELLTQLQRLPVDSAVSLLKSIATGDGPPVGPDHSPAAPTPALVGALPSQLAARPELARLVQFLAAVHALSSNPRQPQQAGYELIVRRFTELQTQLRRQKLAIERLLGDAFATGDATTARTPVFQQTLHLQAARGGVASGRLRCVNRNEQLAVVEFAAGPVLGDRSGRVENARLEVTPQRTRLAPGAAATLTATVVLSDCAALPDDVLDASADILMDGEVALRLWVSVELHDGNP